MSDTDKAQIIEALNLYAFALDAHQWDLFDGIFTDDIVMDLGPAAVAWANLAEFKQGFKEFPRHARQPSAYDDGPSRPRRRRYRPSVLLRQLGCSFATRRKAGRRGWEPAGTTTRWFARTARWKISKRVCRLLS